MTENELKTAVLKLARQQGWSVYHERQDRKANGGGAGYPDLTLARDKQAMWFELKQEKGQLTSDQERWQHELPHAYVIRPSDLENGWLAALLS